MTPEKALHKYGVRPADVKITTRGNLWEVWVEHPDRPNGKQVLTEGNIFYCCRWRGQLSRLDRPANT